METVFLGIGTNVGDRIGNLRSALAKLRGPVALLRQSSVYRTMPEGVGQQPYFYNMVVHVETALSPHELLAAVKHIESEFGVHVHNEPRIIDIDILLFGERIVESPELVVPHPRMHERAFVLVPLCEIAHVAAHPILNKVAADLEDELGYYLDRCQLADEQL